MGKSPITCHVLDSSIGKPAEGIEVSLQNFQNGDGVEKIFKPLASGTTNSDGRCLDLLPERDPEDGNLRPGIYKVIFRTQEYFERTGRTCFYPWVEITFSLLSPTEHYHIPLLISPFSFTTYRGS